MKKNPARRSRSRSGELIGKKSPSVGSARVSKNLKSLGPKMSPIINSSLLTSDQDNAFELLKSLRSYYAVHLVPISQNNDEANHVDEITSFAQKAILPRIYENVMEFLGPMSTNNRKYIKKYILVNIISIVRHDNYALGRLTSGSQFLIDQHCNRYLERFSRNRRGSSTSVDTCTIELSSLPRGFEPVEISVFSSRIDDSISIDIDDSLSSRGSHSNSIVEPEYRSSIMSLYFNSNISSSWTINKDYFSYKIGVIAMGILATLSLLIYLYYRHDLFSFNDWLWLFLAFVGIVTASVVVLKILSRRENAINGYVALD